MKYVRRASASLAVALTLSLLVSCGGKGGSGSSGTTPPSTGDHTAVVGGIVIEPSLGDASVTAEPETAPVILPADEPTAGDYAPTGETVITLGDGISVEGDGATVEGTTVTVAKAGIYLISGRADNGQIINHTAIPLGSPFYCIQAVSEGSSSARASQSGDSFLAGSGMLAAES